MRNYKIKLLSTIIILQYANKYPTNMTKARMVERKRLIKISAFVVRKSPPLLQENIYHCSRIISVFTLEENICYCSRIISVFALEENICYCSTSSPYNNLRFVITESIKSHKYLFCFNRCSSDCQRKHPFIELKNDVR